MATATRPRISAPSQSAMHGADLVFCLASGLSRDRRGLSNASLANVREAAEIALGNGIDAVMMSGGLVSRSGETESELMRRVGIPLLKPGFGIAVEKESRNTAHQFEFLADMMHGRHLKKVVVVCQPDHHRRVQGTAAMYLQKLDVEIIIDVAPAAYGNCHQRRWNSRWQARLWNFIGLYWYWVRGYAYIPQASELVLR